MILAMRDSTTRGHRFGRLAGSPLLAAVLAALATGCGSAGTSSSGASGGASGSSSGGSPGTGGAAPGTGGSVATGGNGVGSGGATGTGGVPPASGGTPGSGGMRDSGGPGGSGGAGARGTTDAGTATDGGPRTSCPAGVLLCDDFESYAVGTAPGGQWKTTTRGAGAAVVDTMKAYSGSKALHFSGSVNKDEAYVRASGAPAFPVQANQLFVRFMMYVQYYPTANPMHVRFATVGATNIDNAGFSMCTYNGVAIERIGPSGGYLRDTTQAMTQAANQNKWVCWEFEISNTEGPAAGGSGKVLPRIWREGTPLTLNFAGNKDNWDPVAFDVFQLSLFAYQSDPMLAHYWIDDVAVSTTRIGCPAAK